MAQEISQAEFDRRLREEFQRGVDSRNPEIETLRLELNAVRPIASLVVVSRKWNEPNINVKYFNDGVSISMSAREFVKALTEAVPLKRIAPMPTRWIEKLQLTETQWRAHHLSRSDLEIQLLRALDDVEAEMKNATMKSPPPILR